MDIPGPRTLNDFFGNMEWERQITEYTWHQERMARMEERMTDSREKGKRGERELAVALSHVLGVDCRRGQQFSGIEGDDVVGVDGVHIECKRVERLHLYPALLQSMRDAKEGEVPVVCHRANGQPWMLTVALEDVARLATVLNKPKESDNGSP